MSNIKSSPSARSVIINSLVYSFLLLTLFKFNKIIMEVVTTTHTVRVVNINNSVFLCGRG